MTNEKDNGGFKTAPLQGVQRFLQLVKRVQAAPAYLPNWGAFYGPSGRGKTTAAAYASLATDALYLECGSTWSQGTLVDSIAFELGLARAKGSVASRVVEIIKCLSDDPKPIIFDEADHLVKKSLVDVVREIGDKSHAPIIFIGEQHLPTNLMQFERAHNRVLEWVEIQPCTLKDAKELLKLFSSGVEIADDLLKKIVTDTDGTTRRIVTNIDRMREFAKTRGLTRVDLAAYMAAVNGGEAEEIYRGVPARKFKAGKAVLA